MRQCSKSFMPWSALRTSSSNPLRSPNGTREGCGGRCGASEDGREARKEGLGRGREKRLQLLSTQDEKRRQTTYAWHERLVQQRHASRASARPVARLKVVSIKKPRNKLKCP